MLRNIKHISESFINVFIDSALTVNVINSNQSHQCRPFASIIYIDNIVILWQLSGDVSEADYNILSGWFSEKYILTINTINL